MAPSVYYNKQIGAEKRKQTIEEKKNKLRSDNQNTVSTHNHDQMPKISFEDRVKAAVNRIKADQAQTKANEMLKMNIEPFKKDSITTFLRAIRPSDFRFMLFKLKHLLCLKMNRSLNIEVIRKLFKSFRSSISYIFPLKLMWN